MKNNSQLLSSTLKTSRVIFFGIALQTSLFSLWGSQLFVSKETAATGGISVYFVMGGLALVTFAYGLRFFQNFTRVRPGQILSQPVEKRKEALLLLVAIHLLLLEFICVIGILLSIFTQNSLVIAPFYVLFVIGFAMSYPNATWFEPFFREPNVTTTV